MSNTQDKREWIYLHPPKKFEVAACDCGNDDTHWSEFKKHLWCTKCEKDFVPKHHGILDGPIPFETSKLMGICFDRYIIATGDVEVFDGEKFVPAPVEPKSSKPEVF